VSDYHGYNYHSKIVNVDDQDYLFQGEIDDPLTMFRSVDELLECEKSNVNRMMGEQLEQDGERL